ncbi:uncharacterized protein LY89DRAFT_741557 [Mollisia scopiformis]|uniref:Uncharacterized protein n=1 Tax=Mollisia scopiformis TaxID=149040 RepID=A0A132B8H3_MOLSC|nr:uncharacterized protein LY89DRAFT_741557 [Mollisia scopiformis]KUJ08710.1 hypothetical protein LY89DRAFT_741557 [Mollisia scopiformis]
MKYSNATDPRDKIYGLLGLMHEADRKSILLQPDYSKSVVQVYGDAIRQMIRENEDDGATNLNEAFHSIERFEDEVMDFPSWIPRWDRPAMLKQVRTDPDPKVPVLKGLKVARVQHVFPLQRKSGNSEWMRGIWRTISILLDAGPHAETKEAVFLNTIAGAYDEEFIKNVEAASGDSLKLLLDMVFMGCGFDLEAYMDPKLVEDMMEVNLDACTVLAVSIREYPFSLFITEDNNLGIGAKAAKVGDTVCVLYGGKLPFLLRPAGS